jgi:hypothetical protein
MAPRIKLPKTAEAWSEADEHMRQVIVPQVLRETDVNAMNHMLCSDIYSYFVNKYGMEKPNQHYQHHSKVQKLKNQLKEAQTEKNAAKKRLRQLRKDGSDPEAVRQLAYEFHHLVRVHSLLNKAKKREGENGETKATKEGMPQGLIQVCQDDP